MKRGYSGHLKSRKSSEMIDFAENNISYQNNMGILKTVELVDFAEKMPKEYAF